MSRCVELMLLGAGFATVVTAQLCSDIDSQACTLFLSARPGYCSDETARQTCSRTCKICPTECYSCNATVHDFHECNTTILCPEGEICMMKELRSYKDGHHEYEMTCQSKEVCDGGPELYIPFVGKREIESRDISITCCADDLCNYPQIVTAAPTAATTTPSTTTAPPVCPKDIVFLVDESTRTNHDHHTEIKNSIVDIVSQLDIGPTANLVGFYGYDTRIHDAIDLDKYTDKNHLLAALQHMSISSSHYGHGYTSQAIHFLVGHALQPSNGDRSAYPDAVVIIGDQATMSNSHIEFQDSSHLYTESQDIILVTLGNTSQSTLPLESLATDRHHVLHVPTVAGLSEQLLPLITQC